MSQPDTWKKTACILCSLNCGLEVQTGGGDGRQILKIRGDDDHPGSQGYVCEKSQRMNYYQNGADRITSPLRRRADGSYEAISWEIAIAEIAAKLQKIKTQFGGESIFYYGGGGQGNHLGGAYADCLLKAVGNQYRSNALAQEKTGEFWVGGKMFGSGNHGDFEHAEVSVFIGKNPWQSHGFARTRVLLREIEKDPARKMIVLDPRKSETARMADFHLAVKPGTDAWCIAAMVAVMVQENLVKRDWIAAHTTGFGQIEAIFSAIPVSDYAVVCGVEESLIREAARCIANASSASVYEDLGVQMNVHSTLVSYLQRLMWVLTGHYGRAGTANAFVPFLSLSKASKGDTSAKSKKAVKRVEKRSPVTNSKVIIGLIPCNVIPEEILTDHPKRFRAMIVQSGNPVHSLADSQRMREAFRALELSVVVDVAMTETARQADYVLPASSQFEKAEATFFNLEFPRNVFQVRQPLFEPLAGTLPEAEIYARLLETMGEIGEKDYFPLRMALKCGRQAFTAAFLAAVTIKPKLMHYAPVLVYRTLGQTLPKGMEQAAVVWALSLLFVQGNPVAAGRAGFGGFLPSAANRLFDAIINTPSGVVFAETTFEESWKAIGYPQHRINLHIAELMPELARLASERPETDPDYPLILAAGERRSDTSNTAIRSTEWHRKGKYGTLRMNPADAEALGCHDGEQVRLSTRRGSVLVPVEISDMMPPGNVSLPNGQGLDYVDARGEVVRRGVAPNELTDSFQRDFLAGTPWHKCVPARVERLAPLPGP